VTLAPTVEFPAFWNEMLTPVPTKATSCDWAYDAAAAATRMAAAQQNCAMRRLGCIDVSLSAMLLQPE
jgi:hypothetical protein